MKRILALLLAASMCVAIVGCKKEEAPAQAPSGASTGTETVEAVRMTALNGVAVRVYDECEAVHTDGYEITGYTKIEEDSIVPGTAGVLNPLEISGTNEVDITFDVFADFEMRGFEIEDGEYYCPLKIKVGDLAIYGMDYNNGDDFEEAVESAITDYYSDVYEVNTDFAELETVEWAWKFEDAPGQTDGKDTKLGNAVADGQKLSLSLELSCNIIPVE